eukprot:CAMPEP_0185034512 /NCGR_PEP_ID=MMETSP1103-20130426/24475_1 /TAXON_ID=36769 /ORGANISM="Paraphysomonas bandaiensis, Strain Caron Lab Isolate" /LENGTH=929 /DNA_ID=CAMNT_0027571199 /DNA_START=228 /DNA_END=3017 /DNA_ORIENTATION=-
MVIGPNGKPELVKGTTQRAIIQVERGVDVALACRIMLRAMAPQASSRSDKIVVVTGDSDLAPALEEAERVLGRNSVIVVAGRRAMSSELKKYGLVMPKRLSEPSNVPYGDSILYLEDLISQAFSSPPPVPRPSFSAPSETMSAVPVIPAPTPLPTHIPAPPPRPPEPPTPAPIAANGPPRVELVSARGTDGAMTSGGGGKGVQDSGTESMTLKRKAATLLNEEGGSSSENREERNVDNDGNSGGQEAPRKRSCVENIATLSVPESIYEPPNGHIIKSASIASGAPSSCVQRCQSCGLSHVSVQCPRAPLLTCDEKVCASPKRTAFPKIIADRLCDILIDYPNGLQVSALCQMYKRTYSTALRCDLKAAGCSMKPKELLINHRKITSVRIKKNEYWMLEDSKRFAATNPTVTMLDAADRVADILKSAGQAMSATSIKRAYCGQYDELPVLKTRTGKKLTFKNFLASDPRFGHFSENDIDFWYVKDKSPDSNSGGTEEGQVFNELTEGKRSADTKSMTVGFLGSLDELHTRVSDRLYDILASEHPIALSMTAICSRYEKVVGTQLLTTLKEGGSSFHPKQLLASDSRIVQLSIDGCVAWTVKDPNAGDRDRCSENIHCSNGEGSDRFDESIDEDDDNEFFRFIDREGERGRTRSGGLSIRPSADELNAFHCKMKDRVFAILTSSLPHSITLNAINNRYKRAYGVTLFEHLVRFGSKMTAREICATDPRISSTIKGKTQFYTIVNPIKKTVRVDTDNATDDNLEKRDDCKRIDVYDYFIDRKGEVAEESTPKDSEGKSSCPPHAPIPPAPYPKRYSPPHFDSKPKMFTAKQPPLPYSSAPSPWYNPHPEQLAPPWRPWESQQHVPSRPPLEHWGHNEWHSHTGRQGASPLAQPQSSHHSSKPYEPALHGPSAYYEYISVPPTTNSNEYVSRR